MPDWYQISSADAISTPTVLVYPDRVEQNLKRMVAMAGDVSRLRPHVKTHKLPQIIALKRNAGIHTFKVSTIAEAEMTAAAGGEDIPLAWNAIWFVKMPGEKAFIGWHQDDLLPCPPERYRRVSRSVLPPSASRWNAHALRAIRAAHDARATGGMGPARPRRRIAGRLAPGRP